MKKPTAPLELNHSAIHMLIRALTKYGTKKVFGSPIEQETFKELQWQLHIALFELQFNKLDDCT